MTETSTLQASKPKSSWLAWGGILFIILIACLASIFSAGGCSWDAQAVAWVDENGNGQWDEGEPPLDDVQFGVNSGSQNTGFGTIGDWKGQGRVWANCSGCLQLDAVVYATPPPGYRLTTSPAVQVTGPGYKKGETVKFGFARVAGFPTPTPYKAGLDCESYAQETGEIAAAPDGSIWTLFREHIARYDAKLDKWQMVQVAPPTPTWFERIEVGVDNTVWLNSWYEAARLQDATWTYYTGERDLVVRSEASVGTTSDGRVWFAPRDTSMLASFDPETSAWRLYMGEQELSADPYSVRLIKIGAVWRAAFGYRSEFTPPVGLNSTWEIYARHIFSNDEIHRVSFQDSITAAKIAPDGALWIVSYSGLGRFDPATEAWYVYDRSNTDGILSEFASDVAIAPDGSIWIVSSRFRPLAFRFTPDPSNYKSGKWRRYDPRDGIPDTDSSYGVAVDREGNIWFGSTGTNVIARCRVREP